MCVRGAAKTAPILTVASLGRRCRLVGAEERTTEAKMEARGRGRSSTIVIAPTTLLVSLRASVPQKIKFNIN